jgi:hypothetical protein
MTKKKRRIAMAIGAGLLCAALSPASVLADG